MIPCFLSISFERPRHETLPHPPLLEFLSCTSKDGCIPPDVVGAHIYSGGFGTYSDGKTMARERMVYARKFFCPGPDWEYPDVNVPQK